jgi:predicted nucleic acid-binding protein
VSVYLDASILVALFTEDTQSDKADAFLRTHSAILVVSDFASAEFASALGLRVRMKEIAPEVVRRTFAHFDIWVARATERALTTSADIVCAAAFLRRLDLPLRIPDALNIALAQRVGAELLTFDRKMAANARALGMPVVMG